MKNFVLATITILVFVFSFPTIGNEEDDFDWDSYPVDENETYETVVVGEPASEQGLSRSRIKKEDITRKGQATVTQALEHEPSVFAASGKKGERTLRLRGFDQRGVAVYFDGVPFALPYNGTADLNKIPTSMIESILVLKGPTSIVHGPGGMGGAVLIETRTPENHPFIETQFETGGNKESTYSAFHSNHLGFMAYALGAGGTLSDGYRLSSQFSPTYYEDGRILDNSDRRSYYLSSKLIFPLPSGNEVSAGWFAMDGTFGIPRSTTDNRPFFSRFNVWRTQTAQLSHRMEKGRLTIEEAVYGAFFSNRLDAYDDATYTTQSGPNAYRSWYKDYALGGRIRADYYLDGLPGGATHIRLWLGARHETHRATLDIGETENLYRRLLIETVPEIEIPIVKTLIAIASMQIDMDSPNTDDAVIDGTLDYKDETNIVLGPLLSLRWDPMDTVMLRLAGARRNRIPSLSERYSSRMGFTEANPKLKPESAWHICLDVDWQISDRLDVSLSAFDAEVIDTIHNEYLPEMNGVTQKRNIGRARMMGGEISLEIKPLDPLRLSAGYAYLYARRLDETDEEDRIAQIPAHQGVFGVVYDPFQWLEFASFFRVIGPQAFDDYNILGLGELGSYAIWDARVQVEPIQGVTAWLTGKNLLDMNYQTVYGFPDRGFSLWLGLKITSDIWN
ncbi:MAG: TonB-dependent receptor [Proteobacteria bacterium]|nr:TonB-dependent receptor [Pseudomonadota bacterium]